MLIAIENRYSFVERLCADTTPEALVQALQGEYAVAADVACADVAAFLGKLRDADLLDE